MSIPEPGEECTACMGSGECHECHSEGDPCDMCGGSGE